MIFHYQEEYNMLEENQSQEKQQQELAKEQKVAYVASMPVVAAGLENKKDIANQSFPLFIEKINKTFKIKGNLL